MYFTPVVLNAGPFRKSSLTNLTDGCHTPKQPDLVTKGVRVVVFDNQRSSPIAMTFLEMSSEPIVVDEVNGG
jgi:hypothetical protein